MNLPKTQMTVKESEWGSGSLYDPAKKCFCIMGFFLNQICKIPKEKLIEHGYSYHVKEFDPESEYSKVLCRSDGSGIGDDLQHEIVRTNDSNHHSNQKTKDRLATLFKKHLNCTLKFKD